MKNDGTQPIFTLKDDLEAAEDSAAPCVAEKTEKEVSEASVSTRLKNLFAARKKSSSNEENRGNELSETEEASADEPRLPDDGDGEEKAKSFPQKKAPQNSRFESGAKILSAGGRGIDKRTG
ncbi:MAG: hypothetical protein ACLRSG_02100 [Christensenellales bacterium]